MIAAAALWLQTTPILLERSHSHNDYLRPRPLWDALDTGLASVEADLFLVEGKLLVAHGRKQIDPKKDFESMYLRPMSDLVRKNGGWIYRGVPKRVWLLIDVKADAEPVYEAVKRALDRYPNLRQAVRPVISGERAIDAIVRDRGKWAGLDGRFTDLGKGYSVELMPWVSSDWSSDFKWFGFGESPAAERERLRELVGRVHAEGRKIRFWGGVDQDAFWREQWAAGVDLLNTDSPAKLRAWTLAHR